MSSPGADWPEAVYLDLDKHKPPPNVAWSWELVKSTKDEAAYFHPDVAAQMESLIMRGAREGVLFKETAGKKRYYWIDVGFKVGASDGKETTLICVERLKTGGWTHGRPITLEELRKRGAQV